MEKIIEGYGLEELEGREVIDFLPKIISKSERAILFNWRNFFRAKQVPYAITETPESNKMLYKLYKLEVAGSEEMKTITFFWENFKVEEDND